MTDSAEQPSEIDKLRAFEQRMHTEGAAGFANGLEPWNDWQETDNTEGGRSWGCDRRPDEPPVSKSLCEKLLPTMATLAVATLAVGIGGVYMSAQNTQLVASNTIQPESSSIEAAPGNPPATGKVVRSTLDSIGTPDKTLPNDHAAATVTADAATDLIAALEPPGMPLGTTRQALATATDTTATTGQTIASKDTGSAVAEPSITRASPVPAAAKLAARPDTPSSAPDITTTLPAPAAGIPAPAAVIRAPAAAAASTNKLSLATPPVADMPTDTRTAAAKTVDGDWVVNISSYRYESMANRKLAEFRNKGVTAEIYPVTIKGKPMYRIRAIGYDSRKEAKTWVSLLQDRLGVDSAWVSKR